MTTMFGLGGNDPLSRSIVDPDRAGAEADKVVEARDHYPYGLRMPRRVLTTGTETDEDYTGHELDGETGMHYAGARYYMSAIGRWTTTDPILSGDPRQLMKDGKGPLLSTSPYNYSLNNPTNLVDPDGRAPQSCCFLIPPLGLGETPDNVAAMAGNKEAQARVAKREGARLGIASLFLPGPEDVVLGAAAATKAGRAIAKYGDEAVGFVKGLFKGGDGAVGEAIGNLKKGGKLSELGSAGDSEGVRLLEGGADDARKLAEHLSGGKLEEVKDGVYVAKSKTGSGHVTFRLDSKSGGPAVDVHGIEEGVSKIHFE